MSASSLPILADSCDPAAVGDSSARVMPPGSFVAARTRERYGALIERHIGPQLGAIRLQKLDGPTIDGFYAHLGRAGRLDGKGGLAPQTVKHIHRLLSQNICRRYSPLQPAFVAVKCSG